MEIRFWGTRGSIPKAGPSTVRYGGNTSCIEVRTGAGTLLVLDCGTGAHALGLALMQEAKKPLKGHLLIGHTHWDHIQGFPFFAPLFVKGNEWDVYAPAGLGTQLRDTLAGQMQYTYFPLSLSELGATLRYHELSEGTFQIGEARVTARYMNHPALTLGYRIEVGGASVVYATDHEPYERERGTPDAARPPSRPDHREEQLHVDFLAGADLLIHDAQYTAAEYPQKVGWGHSTVEYVIDTALLAGVKQLALFHHDPMRDDGSLDKVVEACQARVDSVGGSLKVFGAAEGQTVALEESEPVKPAIESAQISKTGVALKSVLLVVGTPSSRAVLERAVRAEGFEPTVADPGDALIERIRAERPALVVLDSVGPQVPSLAREIREDKSLRELPVVWISPAPNEVHSEAAAAGVSDVWGPSFTEAYARSRVRAWLLRTRVRWLPAPLPHDEKARLEAVHALGLLDTPPSDAFDRLTRLAAGAANVPIAGISLIDTDRQWFKSTVGLVRQDIPRDLSLCAHAILSEQGLMVPDLLIDERFADRPPQLSIRFYAGIPLHDVSKRHRVGTLCVMAYRPRNLGSEQRRALEDLARLAEQLLWSTPHPGQADQESA